MFAVGPEGVPGGRYLGAKPVATENPSDSRGHLLRNLVLFARVLRRAGLLVTPAQVRDLADALGSLDLGRREDVQSAARALWVSRREHLALFDQAFELFWKAARARPDQSVELYVIGDSLYRGRHFFVRLTLGVRDADAREIAARTVIPSMAH